MTEPNERADPGRAPAQGRGASIRLLLVDDHPVFAESLAGAFEDKPGFQVVGVAGDGAQACTLARELAPDIAVVDLFLPDLDGVEVTRQLVRQPSAPRVLILTGSVDPYLLPQAMEAGASGFLLKTTRVGELEDAIRRVHQRQVVVPQQTMERLMAGSARTARTVPLTPREREVLALLAQGSDARTIAKTLDISWHTARSHVKRVLGKLNAHSQLDAVAKAIRMGLISDPGPPGRR